MNSPEPDFSASLSHPESVELSHLAIETVAEITRTSRHLIVVYCRHGLIQPVANPDEGGWIFDEEVIHRLRRIESLRTNFGMNLEGVRQFLELSNELDALRNELRFWRAR
jgi:DNA-binding transcriptional MerR regulator